MPSMASIILQEITKHDGTKAQLTQADKGVSFVHDMPLNKLNDEVRIEMLLSEAYEG